MKFAMILRRLLHSRYSEVLRGWEGATAVLIGGGPSLTLEQVGLVQHACEENGARCIAVNDAYLWTPFADICYFADSHWWKWHTEGIDKSLIGFNATQVRIRFAEFRGQKCSIQSSGGNITDDAVHMLRNRDFPQHGEGLSLDPQSLVTGRNGGFQALNLAVLAGAARIILLGYDGKPNHNGLAHWHGDHPRPSPAAGYPLYRQSFSFVTGTLRTMGVRVVNCSPNSAIDAFPRMALAEALACEAVA